MCLAFVSIALTLGQALASANAQTLTAAGANEGVNAQEGAEGTRRSGELEKAIAEREAEVAQVRAEAIHLLETFLASGAKRNERAEALYKLAELTWEDAKAAYLQKMGAYQAAVGACHDDRSTCREVPRRPPSLDLRKAQSLYQRIITDHPGFRKMDTVLYMFAFSLRDAGQLDKAVPFFQRIIDEYPTGRYVADAWMAIAEHRFYDRQDNRGALAGYEEVIKHQESQLYDLALFKTAWCYWKLGDTRKAAERFKDVLDLAKTRGKKSAVEKKRAEELQGEALEYLVELFTEDDTKSAQDAFEFLAQIGGREYSRAVLRRLADTVFDQTRYERGVEAYRLLISLDPTSGDAPDSQRRVVESLQMLGETKGAMVEMRKLAMDYGPQGKWAKANADRPNTVKHGRDVAEELIRTLARTAHADAQRNEKESRTVDRDRYAQAADAYAFYLQHFGDGVDAAELRYLRADVLYFKLARYADAGDEYLAVGKSLPIGKYHKDALLQAMGSFEKLRNPAGAGRGKRQVTDSDRKFAEAADTYAVLFPNDKEIVTVIYKNGEFFYDYADYDEAVKRFGLIVERYPDNPNARPAGDRILDCLAKAKDYDNIESWARRLKKSKAFSAADEQQRLDRIVVEAIFKSGEAHAAEKRWEKAAAAWQRVVKEYPAHPNAPKALANAGAALEKAQKPEEAAAVYQAIADKYPQSAEAPESLFIAGRIEEHLSFDDKAAAVYEQVAQKYPQSKHGADALRNAGILRQGLGQFDKAAAHFAEYGKRYKDRPDARAVVFQVGLLHAERKDHKSAAAAFADYARTYSGDGKALEALVRASEANVEIGNDGKAKELLKDVDAKKKVADADAKYWLAEGRFLQGELVLRSSERIKIAGKPKQLAKALDEKAKLLDQARTVFLETVALGVPEWATAALERIGHGYESFAKAMRGAAVPKELNQEEQRLYREELEKLVVVIEDKAIDAYKSGYTKALELGVYNKHTQAIREALTRLAEGEYPAEHEARIGPRLGEARTALQTIDEVRRDR